MGLYLIKNKEIKTIYLDEKNISLCKYNEPDEEKFKNFFKHQKLMEKTEKIRYEEVDKIKIVGRKMEFKTNTKFGNSKIHLKDTMFPSDSEVEKFASEISTNGDLELKKEKENKFMGVLNHGSFYTFLAGAIFSALLLSGNTNFNETSGRSKSKLGAKLINFIIDSIGVIPTTVIAILITIFGLYLMFKKLKNPSDVIIISSKN